MDKHDTLLILSNSAENRAHLREVLGEGFNLLEAVNVKQTMLLLNQNAGCIAALLLATTSSLNGMWILSVQYFGYHVAIVVLALKLITAKEFEANIGDYFNCLKFLLVLLFGAMYINSILYDGVSNINFMYVASPPMSGLPFLNENHGWLVYIAHYGCLVLLCVTACYIKPIVKALSRKKQTV